MQDRDHRDLIFQIPVNTRDVWYDLHGLDHVAVNTRDVWYDLHELDPCLPGGGLCTIRDVSFLRTRFRSMICMI